MKCLCLLVLSLISFATPAKTKTASAHLDDLRAAIHHLDGRLRTDYIKNWRVPYEKRSPALVVDVLRVLADTEGGWQSDYEGWKDYLFAMIRRHDEWSEAQIRPHRAALAEAFRALRAQFPNPGRRRKWIDDQMTELKLWGVADIPALTRKLRGGQAEDEARLMLSILNDAGEEERAWAAVELRSNKKVIPLVVAYLAGLLPDEDLERLLRARIQYALDRQAAYRAYYPPMPLVAEFDQSLADRLEARDPLVEYLFNKYRSGETAWPGKILTDEGPVIARYFQDVWKLQGRTRVLSGNAVRLHAVDCEPAFGSR